MIDWIKYTHTYVLMIEYNFHNDDWCTITCNYENLFYQNYRLRHLYLHLKWVLFTCFYGSPEWTNQTVALRVGTWRPPQFPEGEELSGHIWQLVCTFRGCFLCWHVGHTGICLIAGNIRSQISLQTSRNAWNQWEWENYFFSKHGSGGMFGRAAEQPEQSLCSYLFPIALWHLHRARREQIKSLHFIRLSGTCTFPTSRLWSDSWNERAITVLGRAATLSVILVVCC